MYFPKVWSLRSAMGKDLKFVAMLFERYLKNYAHFKGKKKHNYACCSTDTIAKSKASKEVNNGRFKME